MDPLTPAQIQRAIRHLDAGDWPDRATVRTALLMALALGPALQTHMQQDRIVLDLEAPHDPAKADKIIVSTTRIQQMAYVHVAVYDPFGNVIAFALKPPVAKEVAQIMWQRAEALAPTQEGSAGPH